MKFEPNDALRFSTTETQATLTTMRQMMWRYQQLQTQIGRFKKGERIEHDALHSLFSNVAALLS